jgi:hypothetical protein
MRHSHVMVNDLLHELRLPLSRIGTAKLAVLISWYPTAVVREIISKIIPRSFNFYENKRRICFAARTPLSKLPAMVASSKRP